MAHVNDVYEGLRHLPSRVPDGATWQPLPRWTLVLCRLGTVLSPPSLKRRVIVASLPFKDFAATFIALGYVVERLQAGSFEDRFKRGDLVLTIHKGKSGRSGSLAEFQEYLDPCVRTGAPGIALKRTQSQAVCNQWRVGGVQLVRYSGKKKLKQHKTTVFPLKSSSFRTALLGPDDDAWLSGRTLVGMVGHFPNLETELEGPVLQHSDTMAEGKLSEVLLLDENIRVAGAASVNALEELRESNPGLVVFDGASSFEKWRHKFDSAHHVVVMDRASPYWTDETNIIRSAISTRMHDEDVGELPPAAGTGVDLIGFYR